MFQVISLCDRIHLNSDELDVQYESHLKKKITFKYVNKVIPQVGLGVCLYDILEIIDTPITPETGGANFKLTFRLVVLNPFIGEIIQGVICKSDASGIQVTLQFFNDILIPCHLLREPREFDTETGNWYWIVEGHKLAYSVNSAIRFRVYSVKFNTVEGNQCNTNAIKNTTEFPPMMIIGTINDDGLGLLCWWQQN